MLTRYSGQKEVFIRVRKNRTVKLSADDKMDKKEKCERCGAELDGQSKHLCRGCWEDMGGGS